VPHTYFLGEPRVKIKKKVKKNYFFFLIHIFSCVSVSLSTYKFCENLTRKGIQLRLIENRATRKVISINGDSHDVGGVCLADDDIELAEASPILVETADDLHVQNRDLQELFLRDIFLDLDVVIVVIGNRHDGSD